MDPLFDPSTSELSHHNQIGNHHFEHENSNFSDDDLSCPPLQKRIHLDEDESADSVYDTPYSPAPNFPERIYEQRAISYQEAEQILFCPDQVEKRYICQHVPSGRVSGDATFVVDIEYLKHKNDLRVDALGMWNTPSGWNRYYILDSDGNAVRVADRKLPPGIKYDLKITRNLYKNPSASKKLQKKVYKLTDSSGNLQRFAIISYEWQDGRAFDFEKLPHGNTKRAVKSYQPRKPSLVALSRTPRGFYNKPERCVKEEERSREEEVETSLSVNSPREAGIKGYSRKMLRETWQLAAELVETGAIHPFPKHPDTFAVLDDLHVFSVRRSGVGHYSCAEDCKDFIYEYERLFCAHTIATAEVQGECYEHFVTVKQRQNMRIEIIEEKEEMCYEVII